MLNLLKTAWTHVLVAFDARGPLKPTGKPYTLPENHSELDPEAKKKASVCNLFANLDQSVEQIAQYWKISRSEVIAILIEEELMEEQRKTPSGRISGGRRETDR